MKELLEVIAKNLVDDPSQVVVTEVQGERSIILELKVAPEDMGKVIGRQGKIAKALRTLVRAGSQKKNKKYNIEIKERGEN